MKPIRISSQHGFSMVELMVTAAVFSITMLIATGTVKVSGVLNTTADRSMAEGLLVFDASSAVSSQLLCTKAMNSMLTTLPTVGGVPIQFPAPVQEISLTPGCAIQQNTSAPALLSAGQYTQVGICRGGVYDYKINIDNVLIQNILPMGSQGLYSADVVITGQKIASQIYGTTAFSRTVQVYFNFDADTGQVTGCQGSLAGDPQSNCASLGCVWTSANSCDCCTPLGGTPTPMPAPTACILPNANCDLPAGFAWQVGGYSCSTPNQTTILDGSSTSLVDSASTISKGQITLLCTHGALTVDSSSNGPPTCTFPWCQTPATWGGCSSAPKTFAAGTSTQVSDAGGNGTAFFFCPMLGSGGAATLISSNCGVAGTPTPAPTPPVNGACGPSNGGSFATPPTSGLCAAGVASAVTPTGASTCIWFVGKNDYNYNTKYNLLAELFMPKAMANCMGTPGLTPCPINGTVSPCPVTWPGPSIELTPPFFCNNGTAVCAPASCTCTTTYTWTCVGQNGGTTASCQASSS